MKTFAVLLFLLSTTCFFAQPKQGISIIKKYTVTSSMILDISQPLGCKNPNIGNVAAGAAKSINGQRFEIGHINPAPFIAVSAKWRSAFPNSLKLKLRFVSKQNGEEVISEYKSLKPDSHSQNNDGAVISELFYIDKAATHFEIWAEGKVATTKNIVEELFINFFSPYGNDNAKVLNTDLFDFGEKKPAYNSNVANQVNDEFEDAQRNIQACNCAVPTYITRTQWSCPQGQGLVSGVGTSSSVSHLVVHHSAGVNTSTDWNAVVLSVWNYHTATNGWSDVGYNWLIAPNGQLYEGRGSNSLTQNVTGAHFCGTNANTMGVCMLGTYTSGDITTAARATLAKTLAWKCCQQNIPPVGTALHSSSGLTINRISGHRDGCATECPGTAFYNTLPALRTAVQDSINACTIAPCTPSLKITATGCPNNTITFTPTNVTNGGAAPTYSWYVNNTLTTSGSTYTLNNAQNGDKVYARMTSNAACATPTQVNSDTITLSCITLVTPVINIEGLAYCNIAPNPSNGNFWVKMQLNTSANVQYKLYSSNGKLILTTNKERVQGVITKAFTNTNLAAGTYVLEIYIENKKLVKNVVVE